jgi:hypothetical protein
MLGFILALVAPVAAADPVWEVVPDTPIAGTLNGKPVTIRLDPGAPTIPVADAAAAADAGMKGSLFGVRFSVGPVSTHGGTNVATLDLGHGAFKRRVAFLPRRWTASEAVALGPGAVDTPIIRFTLRPAQPSERVTALPLDSFGASGVGTTLQVSGEPVQVSFVLDRDRSLATAGAGATIAAHAGGGFAPGGETMGVRFGIERPVRRLDLARPLRVGPLALSSFWVRTSDFGSTTGVPEAGAAPPDPDEIVIQGKKKRDRSHDRLQVGRDALAACSSITIDKPKRQILLSCR